MVSRCSRPDPGARCNAALIRRFAPPSPASGRRQVDCARRVLAAIQAPRCPSPASGRRCAARSVVVSRCLRPAPGARCNAALIRRFAPPSPASGRRQVDCARRVLAAIQAPRCPSPASGRRCPKGG
ncbi:hypothetical protein XAR_0771 [Xanthomonas citri pv. glycines str. 8ra]|nr:hypothetical protein XAR_0771 [Xanthomonas citri pv. glycines str. 8ra]